MVVGTTSVKGVGDERPPGGSSLSPGRLFLLFPVSLVSPSPVSLPNSLSPVPQWEGDSGSFRA